MKTSIIKRNNGNTAQPTSTANNWVDQLFQENLNHFFNDDLWDFSRINQKVNVPVNIRETDQGYEMSLIAPGLRKEDLKLNVTDDLLTVSYEQKEENNEKAEESWLRKEYKMQSFSRSFTLDDSVDVNKIIASYDNGVLHLSLPKKENSRRISKTIEIK
ncbi:MAG TPA: Hsp20/alpha crystallin family protein [Chitinophagaceae bacterium]